jgi:hypothetical protein
MPSWHLEDLAPERDLLLEETSSESFDRLAFASRAVELVKPPAMRVAIAEGRTRVVVESGRAWGKSLGSRWAMLCVPPTASRRAIATAVAALAEPAVRPWVMDWLFAEGAAPYR